MSNQKKKSAKLSKAKALLLKKPSSKVSNKKPTKAKFKKSEQKYQVVQAKIQLDRDPLDASKDLRYMPVYKDNLAVAAELTAKIPNPVVGGVSLPAKMVLNHRASAKIRTGVRISVPQGFKLCVAPLDSFAEKGLIISNSQTQVGTDIEYLSVHVINVGRELVEINDGDKIARIWVEPVYRLDFKVVETN